MVKNKAPLQENEFYPLPLGQIKPRGWLKDQLRIQAEGMTGLLPDYWEPLGENSGWLGGSGESWERGPYYLDGLVPLAYLLEDSMLIEKARKWLEWTLNSQREDGMFGPADNDDWWPRMVMLKVLCQYEEATGDPRVIPFMLRYFQYLNSQIDNRPLRDWGQARAGENMVSILWLYNRTCEVFLLELMEKLHQQSVDWTGLLTRFPFWRYQTKFDHRVHVVNVAMGLKEPALYSRVSGETKHKQVPLKGICQLDRFHGQLNGLFSGDEWLAGTSPYQGTELCAVMEYLYSLEHLYTITGETELYDRIERIAFNALPATISKDWMAHQYVQQVNQIGCTSDRRNWTENRDDANMFGLEPNFGCCTANMHQGWPKLIQNLWHRSKDGDYVISSYAPCLVDLEGGGSIEVESGYPFYDNAVFTYHGKTQELTLKLRRPGWCRNFTVQTSEKTVKTEQQYFELKRIFREEDQIRVELPMEVRIEDRANLAVGVLRGPLLFSIPLKENWVRRSGSLPFVDYEVFPVSGEVWNYALKLNRQRPQDSFKTLIKNIPRQPFQWEQAPVQLKAEAAVTSQWVKEYNSAGELPISPVPMESEVKEIFLAPYGGCRLRVTELPVLDWEEYK